MPSDPHRALLDINRPERFGRLASLSAYTLIRCCGRPLDQAVPEIMAQIAEECRPQLAEVLADLQKWSDEDGFALHGQDPETGMVRSYAPIGKGHSSA